MALAHRDPHRLSLCLRENTSYVIVAPGLTEPGGGISAWMSHWASVCSSYTEGGVNTGVNVGSPLSLHPPSPHLSQS